jgi:hypothetical protein
LPDSLAKTAEMQTGIELHRLRDRMAEGSGRETSGGKMKHKFIFHLAVEFPSVDYIKAILERCTLDGSSVQKYKIDKIPGEVLKSLL